MPPKKSPLTGYLTILGSIIPVAAILIAMIGYVLNLNSTVNDSREELESIQAQLDLAVEVLELNPYTQEPVLSERINNLEYYLWEESNFEEKILLLQVAIDDLENSRAGTLHYLYGMSVEEGGVQKSIIRLNAQIALLEQAVESIMTDHAWYANYISQLDERLLEMGIRVQMPQDTYSGGYNNR